MPKCKSPLEVVPPRQSALSIFQSRVRGRPAVMVQQAKASTNIHLVRIHASSFAFDDSNCRKSKSRSFHSIPFPANPHATRRLSNNGSGNGNHPGMGQASSSTPGSSGMFRRKSSGASNNVDPLTESGVPRPDQRATRKFDPSTDPDVRKKDTEQVLSRFMQEGSL